jgi:hypothetical protein
MGLANSDGWAALMGEAEDDDAGGDDGVEAVGRMRSLMPSRTLGDGFPRARE